MPFPVDEQYLNDAEAVLNWPIPGGLRERLSRNNGGEVVVHGYPGDPVWWLLPVRDPSNRKRLARTVDHLVKETEAARKDERFPAAAVALAQNGTGDLIVILPDDPEPKWWDHETGDLQAVSTDWLEPQE